MSTKKLSALDLYNKLNTINFYRNLEKCTYNK
jgi:hypothetical protein